MILKNRNSQNSFGKIILPLTIVTFLIAASAFSSGQTTIESYQSITNSDILSYELEFNLPTTSVQQADKKVYTNVNVKGCIGIGNSPGQPTLPKKIIQFTLPPNTILEEIQVIGTPIQFIPAIDIKQNPIFPYQASQPFGSDTQQEFTINHGTYLSNTIYPSQLIDDYTIGYSRGYPIVGVTLNPVQYNPIEGKMYYYPSMTLELNIKDNPTPNLGEIESTNPCGEQPLLPYESCNLGSINLSKMLLLCEGKYEINWERIEKVARLAVRFLDNVIDVNKYPIKQIGENTRKTRKVGLGIMGWATMLEFLSIPYDSEEGVDLASELMSFIREKAKSDSEELAKTRGVFPVWKGSVWEKQGIKIRNATLTTIAPTGTIGIIAGPTSSGIEPNFLLCYFHKYIQMDDGIY